MRFVNISTNSREGACYDITDVYGISTMRQCVRTRTRYCQAQKIVTDATPANVLAPFGQSLQHNFPVYCLSLIIIITRHMYPCITEVTYFFCRSSHILPLFCLPSLMRIIDRVKSLASVDSCDTPKSHSLRLTFQDDLLFEQ